MYDTNQIFQVDNSFIDGKLVDMRAPFSYVPCKTLASWYPDVKEEETKKEKQVKKKPRSKFKYVAAFSSLAFFAFLAVLLMGASQPENQATTVQVTQQPQNDKSTVTKMPLPTYLDGIYISGYVLVKRGDDYHYEYAIHDKNHKGFDAYYYGLTVTPVSPCFAWINTIDKQSVPITCGVTPSQPYTESKDNGLLADTSMSDIVDTAFEAL
ncbi:hypothetical protein UB39_07115 [Photobacterium angustum]|nr:hypothetical protein UB39_07115 [Photobacterium angustum]